MKSALFFFLVFHFVRVFSSTPVSPNAYFPLFDHLQEVNAEWTVQAEHLALPAVSVRFENDDQRIRLHLQLVETALRSVATDGLTQKQTRNRLQMLDVLRQYWQAGKFPRNTGHSVRQPYFVDQYGVACAVGYLLWLSGEQALVNRISSENNYAYVRELAVYPELIAWANDNGFQLEELAWIQPTYAPAGQEVFPVGNGNGTDGRINVMANYTSQPGEWLIMAGDFTSVDGVSANSIIAWDGNQWHTFGEGVLGEIHALHTIHSGVYAAGKFSLPDDPGTPVNIALWKNGVWTPLQTGDMEGSIFSLQFCSTHLYAGGDFQKINGETAAHLAAFKPSENTWTTIGKVGDEEIPGVLSVNGPVRCMACKSSPYLLIGGDFTELATAANHPSVNPLTTKYLAYWNNTSRTWENAFENNPLKPVYAVTKFDGLLVAANKIITDYEDFWTFDAGIWDYNYSFFPSGDSLPHGFVEHDGKLLVYGGFFYEQLSGIYSNGIVQLLPEVSITSKIGFLLDNTVRSAASYKGNAYFAGDFTKVNGQPFNGMFLSPLSGITATSDLDNQLFAKTWQAGEMLHAELNEVLSEAEIEVFNLQGQLLLHKALPPVSTHHSVSLAELPGGVYAYRLKSKNGMQTGKFVR